MDEVLTDDVRIGRRGMDAVHASEDSMAAHLLRGGERLLDFREKRALGRIHRQWADMLEQDLAVAADQKGLRHAVDAPVYRRSAGLVDTDRHERVAEIAEEAPRVFRSVLVVQPGNFEAS